MTTSIQPRTANPTHSEILNLLYFEDECDTLCIVFDGDTIKILLKDIDSVLEYDVVLPIHQVIELAKKFTLKLIQD